MGARVIFQGEFNNTIDPKGRASIPAKFREVLSSAYGDECLVVTKNLDGGLTGFPLSSWQALVKRVQERSPSPEKNALVRQMIGPAVECGFDKQGRIQIPQSLRAHAALEREIVVVGQFDRMELFSQARYAQVTLDSEALLKSNPQFVAEMGF
jgi:MraZ protein